MINFYNRRRILFNIFVIAVFLVLSVISCFLLLKQHILYGTFDGQFHLRRIIELKQSLSHLNLSAFSFNFNHGSAVMTLYPFINLFPIICLSFIFKSYISIIYAFFIFNLFISFIISYYSSISLSKSHYISFLFSVVYNISGIFLCYEFIYMDIGVVTSLIYLPLIIFGFIDLLKCNGYFKLSCGLIFITYSHVLSTLMVILLLILWSIINLKKINKFKHLLLKSLLITVLLTSIVWVKAIYLVILNFGNIYPTHPRVMHGVSFIKLFDDTVRCKVTPYVGTISIIGFFLAIIFYSLCYKKFNLYIKQMFWLSLFFIFVCSNIFPWEITQYSIFKVIKIFQFPFRFYIIPHLMLSFIFAECVYRISNVFINKKSLIMVICIGVALLFNIIGQNNIINEKQIYPEYNESYIRKYDYSGLTKVHHKIIDVKTMRAKNIAGYKIVNNRQLMNLVDINGLVVDYFPITSLHKINYIINNNGIYNHNNTIYVRHIGYNKFKFHNKHYVNTLSLPLVAFNGEHLNLYLDHHLIHHYNSKNNMVTINNVNKGYHLLNIQYKSNIYLMLLQIILFSSGILWIIIIINS